VLSIVITCLQLPKDDDYGITNDYCGKRITTKDDDCGKWKVSNNKFVHNLLVLIPLLSLFFSNIASDNNT